MLKILYMVEIKLQQSFNLKNKWSSFLTWPQIYSLTMFLNKSSNTKILIF